MGKLQWQSVQGACRCRCHRIVTRFCPLAGVANPECLLLLLLLEGAGHRPSGCPGIKSAGRVWSAGVESAPELISGLASCGVSSWLVVPYYPIEQAPQSGANAQSLAGQHSRVRPAFAPEAPTQKSMHTHLSHLCISPYNGGRTCKNKVWGYTRTFAGSPHGHASCALNSNKTSHRSTLHTHRSLHTLQPPIASDTLHDEHPRQENSVYGENTVGRIMRWQRVERSSGHH